MPHYDRAGLQKALLILMIAGAAMLAACGADKEVRPSAGGADEREFPTRWSEQAVATTAIGATAIPAATSLRSATAVPAQGPASSPASRDDCANGWVAYVDPEGRYSLCHPSDLTVRTSVVLGRINVGLFAPDLPARAFAIGLEWRPQSQRTPGNCVGASDPSPYATDRTTDVVVAEHSLPICITHAYTDEAKMHLGYAGLYFEYPVSDGGAVSVQSIWHDPDVQAKQEAIMRSSTHCEFANPVGGHLPAEVEI